MKLFNLLCILLFVVALLARIDGVPIQKDSSDNLDVERKESDGKSEEGKNPIIGLLNLLNKFNTGVRYDGDHFVNDKANDENKDTTPCNIAPYCLDIGNILSNRWRIFKE